MKPVPLVSVITPSYNHGHFIEDTIESVLSQDYGNIEYLVIDGGSTDDTSQKVQKYGNRLRFISQPDNGQSDAINKGFRMASGEILCWINSDDTYQPGAIRRAVEFFVNHEDVMMVYGQGNEIDETGRLIQRFPVTQEFDLWALVYIWDYILQPTAFFRKKIFDELPLLDTSLNWCMDWDLWIRIGSRFKVACIDYEFANSRIYPNTKTGAGGFKRLKEILLVMRKFGRKRYPLGYFIFAQDTIETIVKNNFSIFYRLFSKIFLKTRMALNEMRQNYQGVYKDGWLGERACFMFPCFDGFKEIKFTVQLPEIGALIPNCLTVRINGAVVKTHKLMTPGASEVKVPVVNADRHPIEVTMHFDKTFVPEGEKRKLTCYLHHIQLDRGEIYPPIETMPYGVSHEKKRVPKALGY